MIDTHSKVGLKHELVWCSVACILPRCTSSGIEDVHYTLLRWMDLTPSDLTTGSNVHWVRLLKLTLVPVGTILLFVESHEHLANQLGHTLDLGAGLGLSSILL